MKKKTEPMMLWFDPRSGALSHWRLGSSLILPSIVHISLHNPDNLISGMDSHTLLRVGQWDRMTGTTLLSNNISFYFHTAGFISYIPSHILKIFQPLLLREYTNTKWQSCYYIISPTQWITQYVSIIHTYILCTHIQYKCTYIHSYYVHK